MSRSKYWLIGQALLLLSACGGGGGDGGGNEPTQLTLNRNSVELAGALANNIQPIAKVVGTVTGVEQSVYVVIQQTNVGIETVSFSQPTATSGELSIVGRRPESLGEGIYEDTISVSVCLDQACQRQVSGSPARIDVRYQVSDALTLGSTTLSFSAMAGSSVKPQPEWRSVSVETANRSWRLRSDQPWVSLSTTEGRGGRDVFVSVVPDSLPPGSYSANLILDASDGSEAARMPLSLTMNAPELTKTGASAVELRGDNADDFPEQLFYLRLNTGTREHAWRATLDGGPLPAWLQLQPANGTLNQDGQALQLRVDPAGLDADELGGTLRFAATVNGATVTSAPVSLRVRMEPHRLQARQSGVAFAQLANVSRLGAQVRIESARELPASWTTRIEYPAGGPSGWLSATASGQLGSAISLLADPTSLADGVVALADVIVESSTASISNSGQERIRVGLFVDRSLQAPDQRTLNVAAGAIAVDPVRPYVYAAVGPNIEIYNQYSGDRIAAIDAGGALKSLVLSGDGRFLYGFDEIRYRITVIDLDRRTFAQGFQQPGWGPCSECDQQFTTIALDYARLRGRPFLVLARGQVLDAQTGDLVYGNAALNANAGQYVADISGDGRSLYIGNNRGAPAAVTRNRLDFSELDQIFSWQETHDSSVVAYARGFAVDYEGSRLYRACWYGDNSIDEYDGRDLTEISQIPSGSNGGAFLTADGSLLCARYYDQSDGSPPVWEVALGNRSIVAEYNIPGTLLPRQFMLSADGGMLVALSRQAQTRVLSFVRR